MADSVNKNIAWLFSDKLLGLGLSFIAGVVIARNLGPEGFGLWSYAISVSGILSIFVTLGAENVGIAEVSKSINKELEVTTYFTIRILMGIACLIACFLALTYLELPEEVKFGILLLVFANIFLAFDTADYYYQSEQKTKLGVLVRLLSHSMLAALKVILILSGGGVMSLVLATSFVGLLVGYVHYALLKKIVGKPWLKLNIDFALILPRLKVLWAPALSGFASLLLINLDKIFVGEALGASELGIYAVVSAMGTAYFFFIPAVGQGLYPLVLNAKKESEDYFNETLSAVYGLLIALGMVSGGFLFVFGGKLLNLVFGAQYDAGAKMVEVYSFYGVLSAITLASSYLILATGKYEWSVYRNLIAILTFCCGALFGFFELTIEGVAVGVFCSQIFSIVSCCMVSAPLRINFTLFIRGLNLRRTYAWARRFVLSAKLN